MKKVLTVIIAIIMIFSQTIPVFADTFYDFSDEAQAEFDRQEAIRKNELRKQDLTEIKSGPQLKKVKRKEQQVQTYEPQELSQPQHRTISGTVFVVPKGQEFEAMLQSSISSGSLTENDTIAAVLSKDWIYNGKLIAPAGSVVYGKSTDVKHAGYAYSNGRLAMSFDEVMTPSGDRIRLTSNKVFIDVKNNRAVKIATNVAIGAVGGVALGALYTLISGGNVAHGIAVASAIGAASGLINAGLQKGENAEVPAGTVILVRLVEPVEVVPYEEDYDMMNR